MRNFIRIIKYGRPYLGWLILGFGLIMILAQSQLFMPLVQRFVIDQVLTNAREELVPVRIRDFEIERTPVAWLGIILGTIIGFYTLVGLLSYVRTYLMTWVSQKILFDLRKEAFSHLQRMSMRFYDVHGTGQILSRVREDVSSLRSLVTDTSIDILTDAMMMITMVTIMFRWNWKLTLLSLFILPLVVGNYFFFIGRMRHMWRGLRNKRADLSTEMYESVAGAKVIKAFHREQHQEQKISHGMLDMLGVELDLAKKRTTMGRLSGFFQSLGSGIVLCYGGYLVIMEEMSIGTMVAFYQFLGRLYGPMMKLININATIQEALISAERVFGLLDSEPTVPEDPNATEMPPIQGQVRFNNVSFSYEPESPVLQEVTFEVAPDSMIALIGPSGSGKTTIANLISRFYDPTEGQITIDGHDLVSVTIKSLRDQMGVVLQDNYLFQGSVADNIRFGKLGATDEEVVQAAVAANAHQFIVEDLPEGYQTEVGERGARLSGGQRQRISIARTILRNPRVLVLDEATSALDTESESQIQEALGRLMKGRTSFVIAHRLSTILDADAIITMENGRLVEMGTHDELLAANGLYADMYHKQFKKDLGQGNQN